MSEMTVEDLVAELMALKIEDKQVFTGNVIRVDNKIILTGLSAWYCPFSFLALTNSPSSSTSSVPSLSFFQLSAALTTRNLQNLAHG